ncbi:hypothetical protein U1Q18_015544 [Sarracenia purpurea var. burkii]
MNRVFSVDEMADQFWSPSPAPARIVGGAEEVTMSSSPKMMNRSSSEWAFQRFLQEFHNHRASESPPLSSSSSLFASVCGGATLAKPDTDVVVEIMHHQPQLRHQDRPTTTPSTASFSSPAPPNIPVNSEEYQAFLKSRLNLACAAVALTRVY